MIRLPLGGVDDLALGRHRDFSEVSDAAVEGAVGQAQFEVDAAVGDDLVPSVESALAVFDVIVAQSLVDGVEGRMLDVLEAFAIGFHHRIGGITQQVIVVQFGLAEAPLEAAGKVVGCVCRELGAEEVDRNREVKIDVALDEIERNSAVVAQVAAVVLLHQLTSPLHHAADTGFTDEHVVRLLGQHEAAAP